MTGLAGLQRQFFEAVLAGEPPDARLAIYRRNLLSNRHDALAATYPVVRRLVGDAFFREAARRFALAVPSRSGDLADYGAGFGDFVQDYEHASSLDYLPDVARLEWDCHESYRAADGRGRFDFAALAAIPPEEHAGLRFTFDPSVRLRRSAHPIVSIREANHPDRDGTLAPGAGPEHAFVHRVDCAVRVERLDLASWRLLSCLREGIALGEAAERVGEADARDLLAHVLAERVADGTICAFERPVA